MSSTGGRVAWLGGGVIVVALVQYLERGLGIFHFRPWPLWLITLATVIAAALLSGIQELRAERRAVIAVAESLDAMLACFPPRGAKGLDPYDVGVHPTLRAAGAAGPYVPRDADDGIASAIKEHGIVVVFGPRRAGKSHSGFEAIREADGDAPMIVPDDAEGLATFLRAADSLPLLKHGPAILWLDGLDRLLPGLDMDPIDARVHPPPSSSGRVRRAVKGVGRAIGTGSGQAWAWIRRRKYEPRLAPSLKVVATIRESDLRRVLAEEGDDSHRLRRLLAHARGVRLDATLSEAERARFHVGTRAAGKKKVTLSDAVRGAWTQGWRPAAEHPEAKTSRQGGPKPIALILGMGLLLAVLGALGGIAAWGGGLIKPPSLEVQVHRLSARLRSCQTLTEFPKKGGSIESENDPTGKVLVAIARGGDCPLSDEVRFYRLEHERLTELASLRLPEQAPRHTFSCIGRGSDPCHVTLGGTRQVVVGAFRSTQNQQEFPLVVSFTANRMSVAPLAPPAGPPKQLPGEIKRLDQKVVSMRLRVEGKVQRLAQPGPGALCGPLDCRLQSRRAQAFVVLPSAEDVRPLVLAAAYVARGGIEAPGQLAVRAWRIDATKDPPRAQRQRNCTILRKGRPQPQIAPVKASEPRDTLVGVLQPPVTKLLPRAKLLC